MKKIFYFFCPILLVLATCCKNSDSNTSSSSDSLTTTIQPWTPTTCPSFSNPSDFSQDLPDLPTSVFSSFMPDFYTTVDNLDTMPNSASLLAQYGSRNNEHVAVECALPFNIVNSKTQPVNFVTAFGADEAFTFLKCDYDDPNNTVYPYSPGFLYQSMNDSNPNKDHHMVVIDTGAGKLYETYQLKSCKGKYYHNGAATFNLKSASPRVVNEYRGSADAAGLPILPLLLRPDEVASGEIKHALRLTVYNTDSGSVLPATHWAVYGGRPRGSLPMGTRLRLRKDFDTTHCSREIKVILQCLKKYGVIVADNGTHFAIGATSDERFSCYQHYNGDKQSPSFWISEPTYTKPLKPSDFVVIKWGNVNTDRTVKCDQLGGYNTKIDCQ